VFVGLADYFIVEPYVAGIPAIPKRASYAGKQCSVIVSVIILYHSFADATCKDFVLFFTRP
jgi:hypothetical protein